MSRIFELALEEHMPRDERSAKGFDEADLAAIWPCGPDIGCIPIPYVGSRAHSPEPDRTSQDGTP